MSDRPRSPFRPGYSRTPAVLAGRDEVLAAIDEGLAEIALDRASTQGHVLVGFRGVGKTVLLREIASRAGERYGMPRVRVQATESTQLIPELEYRITALQQLIAAEPAGRKLQLSEAVLKASAGPVGAELHLTRADAAPVDPVGRKLRLERALARLAGDLADRDSGVVITIDEVQLADRPELQDLGAVLQLASEDDWPVLPVLAGLPSVRYATDLGTFFERAQWSSVGLLNSQDTLTALTEPAAAAGRPFDSDAAEYTAQQTGGYPYAIQLYGKHAWRAAEDADHISLEAATIASPQAHRELESSLYQQRWSQTPRSEREYLRAVAELLQTHETVNGGDVARHLNKSAGSVSVYRARLLDRGTLIDHGGHLGFVIPGMAAYVLDPDRAGNL